MTPADYYAVTYCLMAEVVGGVSQLEEQFTQWVQEQEELEYINSPARFAPDGKVPPSVAAKMKEAMEFSAPAPLKEKAE